ncbi:MAG: [FeFe] hydrogenase, group A [Fusobacteriaceae bacterium]|jgi:iron-only hydrogenase group A|nr:[FeFe] hydrogenase, group A [Fusobacteriaceae bacterium]
MQWGGETPKKEIHVIQSMDSEFREALSDVNELTDDKSRKVRVMGRVTNPAIIDIPPGATLAEVISLAGGVKNKRPFKAAQFGLPFGGFFTNRDLDRPIDFGSFEPGVERDIIILSDENCIIQFAKYYVEFLLGKMQGGEYTEYRAVKPELDRLWRNLDRMSKGKSTMRDIYLLRYIAESVKKTLNQRHNLILDAIEEFYGEFEEHIEDHRCAAGKCIQLLKFTITAKCIGCTACARACPVHCIHGKPKERHVLDAKLCTHCGQCVSTCPVGAIFEGDHTISLLNDLSTPNKIVVAQIAPAVRVAIGESFGCAAGENVEKKLVTALRMLGFDYVFDTAWAADVTIMEEATEFKERLERFSRQEEVRLPILTSCCPAWVKFIEQFYPDMVDVPSTVKSPMQIFSTLIKDIWAKEKGYKRDYIASVAIMPCLAKKYEASRPEFSRGDNYDTDYVISTRELIRLLKDMKIDLRYLPEGEFDNPFGQYSGAGIIFGRTGGVIEAVTRTAVELITGKRLDDIEFTQLRGWEGFRIAEVKVGDLDLRIGMSHGLEETAKMLDKIRAGEEFFHAIEIMACKGGCIGGGGQPKAVKKQEILEKRAEGLNAIDRAKEIRRAHDNPFVQAVYEKYLEYPCSHKAHELIHTRYFPKPMGD